MKSISNSRRQPLLVRSLQSNPFQCNAQNLELLLSYSPDSISSILLFLSIPCLLLVSVLPSTAHLLSNPPAHPPSLKPRARRQGTHERWQGRTWQGRVGWKYRYKFCTAASIQPPRNAMHTHIHTYQPSHPIQRHALP